MLEWIDDTTFRLDDTEFVNTFAGGSSARRFHIRKRAELVEATMALVRPYQGGNLVELGVAQGGGTALLTLACSPRRLVAIEYKVKPVAGIRDFIDERGLDDVVRPYYGVDQGDRARVAEIIGHEFDGEPLDLVIDDASHLLDPSRVSFEVLFPRLRPGGLFVLEDWRWQHLWADGMATAADDPATGQDFKERLEGVLVERGSIEPEPPLTRLVIELLLARASDQQVVGNLTVNDWWVTIERGPAEVDPDLFRLSDLYTDRFGLLAD